MLDPDLDWHHLTNEACMDSDAAMKAAAFQFVSGCQMVKSMCKDSKVGLEVSKHCPKTCGTCKSPGLAEHSEAVTPDEVEDEAHLIGMRNLIAITGWKAPYARPTCIFTLANTVEAALEQSFPMHAACPLDSMAVTQYRHTLHHTHYVLVPWLVQYLRVANYLEIGCDVEARGLMMSFHVVHCVVLSCETTCTIRTMTFSH